MRSGLAAMAIVWRADALGVVAAGERLLGHLPGGVGVEVRPGDQPEHLDAAVDGVVGRAHHQLRQLAQQRPLDLAVLAVAGVGHDRRQAGDLGRVADGQRLGDHPAHRDADDVGPLDAEVVEQPGGVVGHVAERGSRTWRTAGTSVARMSWRRVGGGAGIFVDSPMSRLSKRITRKPLADQQVDELERPGDELAAQPHDEQQRLAVARRGRRTRS